MTFLNEEEYSQFLNYHAYFLQKDGVAEVAGLRREWMEIEDDPRRPYEWMVRVVSQDLQGPFQFNTPFFYIQFSRLVLSIDR